MNIFCTSTSRNAQARPSTEPAAVTSYCCRHGSMNLTLTTVSQRANQTARFLRILGWTPVVSRVCELIILLSVVFIWLQLSINFHLRLVTKRT